MFTAPTWDMYIICPSTGVLRVPCTHPNLNGVAIVRTTVPGSSTLVVLLLPKIVVVH